MFVPYKKEPEVVAYVFLKQQESNESERKLRFIWFGISFFNLSISLTRVLIPYGLIEPNSTIGCSPTTGVSYPILFEEFGTITFLGIS